jgi:3-phenylpropionate/trans-cinnamate dioxygenase ferredoxin component
MVESVLGAAGAGCRSRPGRRTLMLLRSQQEVLNTLKEARVGEFVAIGKAEGFAAGEMKMVRVHNKEILLARVGGRYYAANGRCPHMGGALWRGKLEGTVVTCPLHSSRFDLVDGRVLRWTNWSGLLLAISRIFRAPRRLTIYEVKVEGDSIMVGLEEKVVAGATGR